MREALLKKRYGIPVALLLVLLLSGTALAWYCFDNMSSDTTVQEPLSTANESEFSATMHPGETNQWSFNIVNSADVRYMIKADLTFDAPDGVSITSFFINHHHDGSVSNNISDLTDDNSATFRIYESEILSCTVNISAAGDATPGEVSASFVLSRK